jgi:AcrR family transcriptional regulator
MKITALTETNADRRAQLTRDRVLEVAIDLADREGIAAVSMRKLGQELGIEAMSLYTHVRNKDDLLDGMVDAIIAEIPILPSDGHWKSTLRRTILAARDVLLRHPWAPRIIESRTDPGPAVSRYINAVIGIFRESGFSIDLTHHALHLMGSRMLGFSQDLYDDSGTLSAEEAAAIARHLGDTFPYIAEMVIAVSHEGGLGGCDDNEEFAFALEFLLDGLERLHAKELSGG